MSTNQDLCLMGVLWKQFILFHMTFQWCIQYLLLIYSHLSVYWYLKEIKSINFRNDLLHSNNRIYSIKRPSKGKKLKLGNLTAIHAIWIDVCVVSKNFRVMNLHYSICTYNTKPAHITRMSSMHPAIKSIIHRVLKT